jgi:hypothetical protein
VLAHKTLWIALYSQSIMQAAFGEPGGLLECQDTGIDFTGCSGHDALRRAHRCSADAALKIGATREEISEALAWL